MNPRDVCNWIGGVLMMAEDDDGGVKLTKTQYEKIKQRLDEVIKEQPQKAQFPPHMKPGNQGLTRC